MRWSLILAMGCAMTLTTSAAPARGEVTRAEVERAIGGGVRYLRQMQGPDGSWGERATGLVILALLTAGESADAPDIARAIDWSINHDPDLKQAETYTIALQIMVLVAVDPVRYRDRIAQNAAWLERSQIGPSANPTLARYQGSWSYRGGLQGGDHSNTQYALLGLNTATEAGVPVPDEVWQAARLHWESCQNPDGGWSYQPGRGASTASMTCAGISSLIITGQRTRRGGEVLIGDVVRHCGHGHHAASPALDRAIDWLGRRFTVTENFGGEQEWRMYYLYGLERAGRLSGRRTFGGHDWYRKGTEELVRTQRLVSGEGEWWEGSPVVSTSFAILFLAKGRTPVLIDKLQHGPVGDWDNDPDDARNLTALAARDWDRPLTWQVVDPGSATVEDLSLAPIALINGHAAPTLTAEGRRRLRDYIDQGGFLVADACCGRPEFDRGIRALIEELFPGPGQELHLLAEDHPIWRSKFALAAEDHPLWGVEFGCRTVLVYSPKDLSCYWNLAERHPDHRAVIAANRIGLNIVAYATGGEPPADKLAAREVALDKLGSPKRGALWIAKLRHAGRWDAAPLAIPNLMAALRQKRRIDVVINQHAIEARDPNLTNFPLVYVHGRGEMSLTAEDLAPLRRHLEPGGGTIFADATCGSPDFDAGFRKFVADLLPGRPLEPIPPDDRLNTLQVGYDLSDVKSNEAAGDRQGPPRLEGVKIDGRWAIIYSKIDIGCALEGQQGTGCKGYTRESAVRIATNIVLYATLP